jgi:AbrB family looped-hinge helix DNA binding protein
MIGDIPKKWGEMILEERNIDAQGRVSLPVEWRKKFIKEGEKVLIRQRGKEIIITPIEKKDITAFFDSVPVEIKSDISDWEQLKKELLTGEAQ